MNNEIEKNMVSAHIERLEKALRYTEKIIDSAPDARVVIRNKNGHPYLSMCSRPSKGGSRKEQYVALDSELAATLLNKEYCLRLRRAITAELCCLRSLECKFDPEKKYRVLDDFPAELQPTIHPVFKNTAMLKADWQRSPFPNNTYLFDQAHTLLTKRGESVRSKSEVIIANVLDQMGLAYKYECMYQFGSWQSAPDFTVFNERDGLLYYIEYFGMMDDAEYQRDALKKISRYQQTPDANRFIYIFESKDAPMNMKAIENLLRVYFVAKM